jgi:hypothetical protein
MRGIADASGVEYHKVLGIHMIGEVTKGSCSMFGAWGTATASTGALLQLRALDWDVDGPFKNFPQITVYHSSNASDGNTFANVGWTGWLGSITGMNDKRMVKCHSLWCFPVSVSLSFALLRRLARLVFLFPTKHLEARVESEFPSLFSCATFFNGTALSMTV